MAMSTSFKDVNKNYSDRYWKSIDDFEEYWLKRISETREDWNYYTDRDGKERVIEPVNHFPELKEYEVWMGGYAATGESGGAHFVGKAMARNFGQACHIVICKSHLSYMEKENAPNHKGHVTPARWDYDPTRLTYWGCGLYWSQQLAEKSFG